MMELFSFHEHFLSFFQLNGIIIYKYIIGIYTKHSSLFTFDVFGHQWWNIVSFKKEE